MKKEAVRNRTNYRNNIIGWIFSTPYLLYSVIFFLIPLIWAFWISTTDWNLMSSSKKFVGLANFEKMFGDERIQAALFNSLKYLFFIVILSVIVSLAIGLLLHNLPDKLKGILAVLFFIPYLTSGVATSVIVKYFFSYNSIFNQFLRNHFSVDIRWLQDPKWAFGIMIGIVIWKMSGYYALFMLSAIESISDEVNDACKVDGSTGFNKLFHVTIPMIMPTLTTVVILASGLAFGIFTEPYLLTGGGPALATTTWQLEIYNTSFVQFQSGYGAAIAIVSAIQIFITIRIITFFMNGLNKKYGW